MAAANVVPPTSVSARALAGSIAPVSSRLPRQATPNLAPSSSVNAATATGRRGLCPRSRRASMAANAVTTPRGPSKAPPSGTESRWLPVTIAPGPGNHAGAPSFADGAAPGSGAAPAGGGSHHAHRLPLWSVPERSPRSAAAFLNQDRHAASAGVQENRR